MAYVGWGQGVYMEEDLLASRRREGREGNTKEK
ncbi:hypothetical protein QG37_01181 [Candidozyma auris]|uniref:Uncharacterized protein n=1 Tax=Candidozyma auris TaxID=498019 RepID=A0A0L0P6A9_CANAR|nr:hypothetical protein QG37_01181 [[Candida] auris]